MKKIKKILLIFLLILVLLPFAIGLIIKGLLAGHLSLLLIVPLIIFAAFGVGVIILIKSLIKKFKK